MTHFLLQFTDTRSGERHYFRRLGGSWPHRPELRLIDKTTPHADRAAHFPTLPAALEIWVTAGRPTEWRVLEMDGDVVKLVIEP